MCSCSFRVWDKVISGSCKILVFVAMEILLSYKIVVMGTSRPEGVVSILCNVSDIIIIGSAGGLRLFSPFCLPITLICFSPLLPDAPGEH